MKVRGGRKGFAQPTVWRRSPDRWHHRLWEWLGKTPERAATNAQVLAALLSAAALLVSVMSVYVAVSSASTAKDVEQARNLKDHFTVEKDIAIREQKAALQVAEAARQRAEAASREEAIAKRARVEAVALAASAASATEASRAVQRSVERQLSAAAIELQAKVDATKCLDWRAAVSQVKLRRSLVERYVQQMHAHCLDQASDPSRPIGSLIVSGMVECMDAVVRDDATRQLQLNVGVPEWLVAGAEPGSVQSRRALSAYQLFVARSALHALDRRLLQDTDQHLKNLTSVERARFGRRLTPRDSARLIMQPEFLMPVHERTPTAPSKSCEAAGPQ